MKYFKTVFDIPREEYFVSGHRACQGCTCAIAMRLVTKAVAPNMIIAQATGCMEVVSTIYPDTAWRIPWVHVAFENAAAVASGIEAAIKAMKRKGLFPKDKKVHVLAIGGDGGTFDIGMQALSGALERGHDFVYICYDNEAYMNTGIQRSGATPYGAWTTTSPPGKLSIGKKQWKKDLIGIALAHRIPYAATTTPAYPLDLINKVKKAAEVEGPAVIHILASCVPGWRIKPEDAIKVLKLAVQTGMWVNYEVENGAFKVTTRVPKRKPDKEYLRLQGRFKHLTDEEIAKIQAFVDEEVERINKLAGEQVIGPVEE